LALAAQVQPRHLQHQRQTALRPSCQQFLQQAAVAAVLILAQVDQVVLAVAVVVTPQVGLVIRLQLLRRKETAAAHLHKAQPTHQQAAAVRLPQAAQVPVALAGTGATEARQALLVQALPIQAAAVARNLQEHEAETVELAAGAMAVLIHARQMTARLHLDQQIWAAAVVVVEIWAAVPR
jgi:hypothetical protein